MSDSRLFFTGNTLEQAVMSAARHYSVSPDDLAYERIERKSGFLRTRRRIVIRVDPENPARPAGSAAPIAAPETREAPEVAEVPQTEEQSAPPEAPEVREAAEPSEGSETPEEKPEPAVAADEGDVEDAAAERRRRRGRRRVRRDEPDDKAETAVETVSTPDAEEAEAPAAKEDGAADDSEGERDDSGEEPRREARPRGRRRRRRAPRTEEPMEVSLDEEPLEEADDEPSEPRAELPPADGPAAEAAADCAVQLARLADLDLEIEVFRGEDQLEVELAGVDQELLVRGEGRLLLSIQHLLPRLMQGELGEMSPCRVDSGGFRDRRVASLRKLAASTAEEVGRRGRPRTLRSMSPADRRTVHMALKDDDAVTTDSAGDGFYKRVTVRPT